MSDMTLTKFVKNKIAEIIQAAGLNINDFAFEVTTYNYYDDVTGRPLGNYQCSILKRKDCDCYFAFNHVGNIFNPIYSPSGIEKTGHRKNIGWQELFTVFNTWIKDLKLELSEPDLWAEFGNIFRFKSPSKTIAEDSINFSENEIKQLSDNLHKIKSLIIDELKPSSQQINNLEGKINYLVDSAKKQDIQSWYFLFIGVVMNIAFYYDVPQKVVQYFQPIIDLFNRTQGLLGIK
jgi:hypothetical protein